MIDLFKDISNYIPEAELRRAGINPDTSRIMARVEHPSIETGPFVEGTEFEFIDADRSNLTTILRATINATERASQVLKDVISGKPEYEQELQDVLREEFGAENLNNLASIRSNLKLTPTANIYQYDLQELGLEGEVWSRKPEVLFATAIYEGTGLFSKPVFETKAGEEMAQLVRVEAHNLLNAQHGVLNLKVEER